MLVTVCLMLIQYAVKLVFLLCLTLCLIHYKCFKRLPGNRMIKQQAFPWGLSLDHLRAQWILIFHCDFPLFFFNKVVIWSQFYTWNRSSEHFRLRSWSQDARISCSLAQAVMHPDRWQLWGAGGRRGEHSCGEGAYGHQHPAGSGHEQLFSQEVIKKQRSLRWSKGLEVMENVFYPPLLCLVELCLVQA